MRGKKKAGPAFTVQRVLVGQVKYFEALHVIRSAAGEVLFTGSEETAKKVLRLLNGEKRKRG